MEDSNAGFDFFRRALPNIRCISAGGNANIIARLNSDECKDRVIILADGAAFGAYIENIISLKSIRNDIGVYLPESFEWLILRSGILNATEIPDILEHPEDFIDSSIYFSWERFFTKLLEDKTGSDEKMHYSKARLSDYFLTNRSIQKIMDVIPESIRGWLETRELFVA